MGGRRKASERREPVFDVTPEPEGGSGSSTAEERLFLLAFFTYNCSDLPCTDLLTRRYAVRAAGAPPGTPQKFSLTAAPRRHMD